MRLGADPEVFLQDAAGGLIASCGKIGGTKDNPRPLPLGDGFAVQEDNVALEYNIPPAESADEFIAHITTAMGFIGERVNEMGLAFNKQSAAFFPLDQLVDPKALEFGCDPDFDAWTKDVNQKPKASNPTLRSCGGHIHVGDFDGDIYQAVKRMDLWLAVPSVLMDSGELRKQLYGKAGAMRPKPYGFEYRTLSNFWIFNPQLIKWAWENTQRALDSTYIDVDAEKDNILEAINNNNKQVALSLINQYNIPMCYANGNF